MIRSKDGVGGIMLKSQIGNGNTTRSERVLLKTRSESYTGSQRMKRTLRKPCYQKSKNQAREE